MAVNNLEALTAPTLFMIPQKHIVPLTIFFIFVAFEIYFVFSDQSHQEFFQYVGIFLIFITILAAYLLYSGLNLKTKYVQKLVIDPSESDWNYQNKPNKSKVQKPSSALNVASFENPQAKPIRTQQITTTQKYRVQQNNQRQGLFYEKESEKDLEKRCIDA